jgi:hypothetical protein
MTWPDGLGITAWSRICREPDCWWCGPPRDTDEQAAEDLADHMDEHYRKETT